MELERLPRSLRQLTFLTEFQAFNNKLVELPEWFGELRALRVLVINANRLQTLPDSIGDLADLEELYLGRGYGGNPMRVLPRSLRRLTKLRVLSLNECQFEEIPDWLGELPIADLKLYGNPLRRVPRRMPGLVDGALSVDYAQLATVPELPELAGTVASLDIYDPGRQGLDKDPSKSSVELADGALARCLPHLAQLRELRISGAPITSLPDSIGQLAALTSLQLTDNALESLPDTIGDLAALTSLDLTGNSLRGLPESVGRLRQLSTLTLARNQMPALPTSLGSLPHLHTLSVSQNPLSPELVAAADEGTAELLRYLRLLDDEGEIIREAKLLLVGEGEVGKSSLLAALRDEDWVERRDTTHGIEIKTVTVTHDGTVFTLNGWDFGGQKVYRPTHQIFFTEPAIYLVVWKPREGPELGLVEHWISMIRQRAGTGARVHVVATHGGPTERYAFLDEVGLRERFPGMIEGFHHVDSHTRFGIEALRTAIAATAAQLPTAQRHYPSSWLAVRTALAHREEPSMRYEDYEALAARHGLSARSARSLAVNANALGHWVHYADDPTLAELVVLKPDWLSIAIGFVLEDPDTVRAGGLLPHRRLGDIWDNPLREPRHRYRRQWQQIFLRLMERFELTYRVPELTPGEPMSLVAQLVPADRPDLREHWETYRTDAPELTQVVRVTEHGSLRPTLPEGLIYRLTVLFHRYSLGREDVMSSAHWQGGIVLQDRYGSRALVTLHQDGLSVRVRGPYPQSLVTYLVAEIRSYIEDFWKGLAAQVMVPCRAPCPLGTPGQGLFDLDKLIARRAKHKHDFPCPASGCDDDADIDELLLGVDVRGRDGDRIVAIVREALRGEVGAGVERILARIEDLDDSTMAAFSRADENLDAFMRSWDDEAANGPRLFSLVPLGPSILHPNVTSRRMRLTLWCEHSRLPVYLLDPAAPTAGVYEIDVPRTWWVTAAPFIRTTSALLKTLLPISLAAVEFELSDRQWDAVNEQLTKATDGLSGALDGASALADDQAAVGLQPEHAPTYAEGGVLRLLHTTLAAKDPTFADLRKVRDQQGRFIWVHKQFVPIYLPPLPEIPAGRTQ